MKYARLCEERAKNYAEAAEDDARAARAAWAAGDAGAAWAAGDALRVYYTARMGWVSYAPGRLTVGLRDAYTHGLGLAIPTGIRELGWAMDLEEAA